jgi:cytochrome oxidase assembly protein ShyY1
MSRSKSFANAIIALAFAALFVFLGFWQLDRAAQVKELQKPFQESPIIALSEVATPSTNLSGDAVNRIVEFSGSYVTQYLAPKQVDSKESSSNDWSVALMEVDGGGLLLVVRGVGLIETPRGEIAVKGRIYHRQFEDRAPEATLSSGQLRRIDPSLLLAEYSGDYYDGYVIAISEEQNGRQIIESNRVPAEPTEPTVPGYYWQHIAYVVIWWLMAGVVLFLPLYSNWRNRQTKGELN